ncbi:putative serine/threonine-protein kinase PBL4 [Frankliniella fusca]|uniref:Serine/threonine-protein kinase PBL4 n=1 Tax=Frankliniella fusca TaxID=407009 RepID=A0AAE1LRR6_9NEOP|nr:putative serine/threonine-protein kinase PBL4 [Frankliniella fusca]
MLEFGQSLSLLVTVALLGGLAQLARLGVPGVSRGRPEAQLAVVRLLQDAVLPLRGQGRRVHRGLQVHPGAPEAHRGACRVVEHRGQFHLSTARQRT